ncbi:MAG: hypothetical protein WBW44_09025 [Solirubrobacterales bacterium]
MDLVDEIFAEYVISFQAGEGDPRPFMARVTGQDQAELEMLIDSYLSRAPGRQWDPEAFRGSAAERLVEPLTKSLMGQSGTWPVLLPGLRHKARIQREELVARLAEGLGVAKSTDRVWDYYHGMEQGTVSSDGVSDQVLNVLGKILGSGVQSLRQAGMVQTPGGFAAEDAVFARVVPGTVKDMTVDQSLGMPSPVKGQPNKSTYRTDVEVDRLFTGGND